MKQTWISLRFFTIAMLMAGLVIALDLGLTPQIATSEPKTLQVLPLSTPLSPARSYGHFPYRENDSARLQTVGQYVRNNASRPESMDIEAVQAFQQMSIAAKQSGVLLMPLSGFRSVRVQTGLWKQQIARRGSQQAAAKWSAPPGYSEHHTGYALDIADQTRPNTDLRISFENTRAYQWLAKNGSQYGFELSFPLNNKQGIGYEPWHWRYVGSARAEQVFALAHQTLQLLL
ncbi:MAG: D-alanyl-D-alanine carboxypeptidase family protein [Leptolyngbya sp. Prado105]|jgi:LAS superfamily LD-carboxypeptidase LdcB|nr:D-alanyl-D-alanine carboxypeptidase family protein [Leptolyngbya sp. Prado105]